jgi:serine protease Do
MRISWLARFLCGVTMLTMVFAMNVACAQTNTDVREQAIRSAIQIASSSVVQLEVISDGIDTADASLALGPRSAVVLSADGWLVTASANLGENPRAIGVRLSSQELVPAELIGHDTNRHLALLKISAAELSVPQIANNSSIQVGQTVIAIGKSFQPDRPVVSEGIISAKDRFWRRAIQTDAKVSPWNYGGALCNLKGEVLGVLLPLGDQSDEDVLSGSEWYDSGIGFAIPLEDIFQNLERWKTIGDLRKGLWGVGFSGPANLNAEPRVASCWPGSPAARSGLQAGSLILRINDQPVATVADLKFAMDWMYAGDNVQIDWETKAGERRQAVVELVETLPEYRLAAIGVVPDRNQIGTASVLQVVPGSAAQKAGILAGDLLVAIDDRQLNDTKDLRALIREKLPGDSVDLDVRRLGEGLFRVNLELGEASAAPLAATGKVLNLPVQLKELSLAEFPNRCWRIESAAKDSEVPLLIWLDEPGKKKSREETSAQWAGLASVSACVIVVEPSRDDRWLTDEADVVMRALQIVARDRKVDLERVAIGGRKSGAELATLIVARNRKRFRGLILEDIAGSPNNAKMPALPDSPLYLLLSERLSDKTSISLDPNDAAWSNWKIPRATTNLRNINDQQWSTQMLNWLESLDRM